VNYRAAAASYNQVKNHSAVENADAHRLIDMLFDGLLERIAQARGAMQHKMVEAKGQKINSAIAILSGLRENLNHDADPEISANLDALYAYVQDILSKAHRINDLDLLDEATQLISNVASAWKQIGGSAKKG